MEENNIYKSLSAVITKVQAYLISLSFTLLHFEDTTFGQIEGLWQPKSKSIGTIFPPTWLISCLCITFW